MKHFCTNSRLKCLPSLPKWRPNFKSDFHKVFVEFNSSSSSKTFAKFIFKSVFSFNAIFELQLVTAIIHTQKLKKLHHLEGEVGHLPDDLLSQARSDISSREKICGKYRTKLSDCFLSTQYPCADPKGGRGGVRFWTPSEISAKMWPSFTEIWKSKYHTARYVWIWSDPHEKNTWIGT